MLRAQYETRGPVPQDVIHAVEFEAPGLEAGQALPEVIAAPINPSDLLTLTGLYGRLPPLPAVGGGEGVGRVVELGPDTRGPAVGQVVLLPVGCGSWSTHVVAEAAHLAPLPAGADPLQLAMMTINPPTASLLLSEFVKPGPDEWVIQNAANSAVGLYLVQLARQRGYRTVNVVRREDAAAVVAQAGGDVVLVDGEGLANRVAEATGKAKIRLGIDAVGGKATGRLAECLANGATLVNYGRMSGEPCTIEASAFVFHDLTVRGFWLASWFQKTPEQKRGAVFGEIARLIAEGRLHAPIQATYDVSEIKEAVAAAARGEREGKILIVPKGQP
ncbi:MAG TPA: zinc-dependent alcohol dehydrogenase family protein [Steroidobacteraceae bacterium]|nr:zinc-dependent alcohol dehydrogenase family protein [Steroidobacteraceae bacterium]